MARTPIPAEKRRYVKVKNYRMATPKEKIKIQAYCFRCRGKKQMKDGRQVTLKNGRRAVLVEPHSAVSKQADDSLISQIISMFNEILHLLWSQARQYHLSHLGRVYSGNRVILNEPLPVQPVAECSYGSVIAVLAVMAVKIRQEIIYAGWSKFMTVNELLQTAFVEFKRSWGYALPSCLEELGQEDFLWRTGGVEHEPCRSRTCDHLIKSQGAVATL